MKISPQESHSEHDDFDNVLDPGANEPNENGALVLKKNLYKHSPIRRCSRMLLFLICTFVIPFVFITVLSVVLSSVLATNAAMKLARSNVEEIARSIVQNIQTTIDTPPRMLRQMYPEFYRRINEPATPFLQAPSSLDGGMPIIWDASIAADKQLPLAGAYLVIEKPNEQWNEAYGIVVTGLGDSRKSDVWRLTEGKMFFVSPKSNSFEDVMDTVQNNTGTIKDDPTPGSIADFPWYLNARDSLFPTLQSTVVYSQPYNDPVFDQATFLSCFHQMRNSSGHFLGLVGIDLTLQSIQEYMNTLNNRLGTGVAFILNGYDNSLVATSDKNAPSTITKFENGVKNIERVQAVQSTNIMVSAGSKHLVNKMQNGDRLDANVDSISVDGYGGVLLSVQRVKDSMGVDWLVAIAYPESEFTSTLTTMRWVNSVVSVVCMLVAVFMVIVLSICFMIPLVRLRTEMRKVELMKLDEVKHSKSVFYEVFSIQASFFAMKEKLRLWRTYLPEHVLLAEGLAVDAFEDDKNNQDHDVDSECYSQSSSRMEKQSKVSKAQSKNSNSLSDKSKELESNLGLKSVYRTASSIVIRIANYHRLAQNQSSFIDQHGIILDRIRKICSRISAVLDHFDEREFHISLNAMLPVKQYHQTAVRLAIHIDSTVKKANAIFTHDKKEMVELVYGISAGSTYCGTIGTSTLRKNCIYGPARENAISLCAIAESLHHLHVKMLMDSGVESRLDKNGVKYRPFGVYAFKHQSKLVSVFHVSSMKDDVKNAEWMYELSQQSRFTEWNPLLKAFSLIKKSKFEEAQQNLKALMEDDPCVSRWISFCQKMLSGEHGYHELQRRFEELNELEVKTLFGGSPYVDALTSISLGADKK